MLTAAALASGGASAATAQHGVFVDPDSPTAKEYAIPLEAARRAGSGGKAPTDGMPPEPAPLFGEGVGDGDGSEQGGGSGIGTRDQSASQSQGPGRGKTGSPSPAAGSPLLRTTRPGAPRQAGVGSSLPLVGGAAGALLILGVGLGYLLRRRRVV